jgi:hypothetical protein
MKSFKINSSGDWVLNEMVEGDDELIQCLTHLIYERVGEWFLNENHGFRREVLETKQPDEKEITQALHDCLYQEPRVQEVINIDYEFDRIKRKLAISFVVRTNTGQAGGELNVDLTRI